MSTWQQPPIPPVGFHPPPQGQQESYPPPGTAAYGSQPGGYPPQPGVYPPQPGVYPPQTGMHPPQPGMYPPQPGMYPPQPGVYPPQPGMYHPQAGAYPPPYPGAEPIGAMGGLTASSGDNEDPFKDHNENFQFSTKSIRHAFVRKVYAILMSQLLVTVGFIAFFMYHQPTKVFVQHHPGALYAALGVYIGAVLAISCCEGVRRKSPGNYICLLMLTLAMSYMTGAIASFYDTEAVLMAAGITTVVCLSLSIFAFQTKWDFTMLSGVLCVATVILLVFGIVCIFVKVKILTLVYSCLGVLLFSVFLVYDTQRMMGGNHKFTISPEEYIFAALCLYIDIMQIFLYILQIIGMSKK
ncbi:protein lifeguard 1-like isoform X2 [Ischnura elegans]|nr:protein lifeguard 1-like isoform X2 [Ischnura elegans]XP_046396189.1 protein lifeguard 1-like isoform X2 [Ischnura elegans]